MDHCKEVTRKLHRWEDGGQHAEQNNKKKRHKRPHRLSIVTQPAAKGSCAAVVNWQQ